ncbi:tRNA (adenine(58)-N(1))-methyltransferase non-catalytic subunit TRM6-like [Mizuhopecten yessoensis]|uniref:tRNA (adenine(58)-N(1))-methyltransferase non-catalytic subunit TRM6 n=1 Tax=Mizuhopecten yessoensis TaxID=6573 RepID=A0A210PPN5_MIZYE|nr:tRNA (adenine(58)-N(1))-methyltransferase non-catalytic subunit TRM6-like [Mizuhopecten yessoensis]OWF38416.1 tRNA (adenine(58)-N(1))-methyltransferase non-catalytic subunit TRM6 [Mizuhopecten yessoensis]
MASDTSAAGSIPDNLSTQHIIKEGDQVILKKGKNIKVFQIKKRRQVWLEKAKFTLDGTIGHPYGTTFEVKNGKMIKVEKSILPEKEALAEGGKDNRDLLDQDSNQKLTRDDIEKMKKDGIKGKEIIDQLIENSSTFQSKTVFAQAKWIKKKKIKHLLEFTILKPSARLLCEMHHTKNPSRICFMRVDSLAQILSRGNVRAHSTVAVVDTCMGLVVGAVMERLGGFGKVIHFHQGITPVRPAMDSFDFPAEILNNLYSYPLDRVNSIESDQTKPDISSGTKSSNGAACVEKSPGEISSQSFTEKLEDVSTPSQETGEDTSAQGDTAKSVDMSTPSQETTSNVENTEDGADDINSQEIPGCSENMEIEEEDKPVKTDMEQRKRKGIDRETNRQLREQKIQEARDVILEKNIDCLIVACKFHPTPIVLALLKYVAPSRPIVVFGQYKEPILDCYEYLRKDGGMVNYRVSEAWLREYQVMEMRTHPVISMSGGGGYLLTATTVAKSDTPK